MKIKSLILLVVLFATGCAGVTQPIEFSASKVVTEKSYTQNKTQNGVVLLDINWGRFWGCGNYENAQLIGITFDKMPLQNSSGEAAPDFVLKSPARLAVKPIFLNYAYSLPAGEYALSGFSIKAAKSVNSVGFITLKRNDLFESKKPLGGTFTVSSGENVFIGNFYLDCAYGPTLWRYHSDGKDAFQEQISEYQKSYPFLDLSDVKFRLFKTKEFGNEYEL